MANLWERHGFTFIIVFYLISITIQIVTSLLIYEDTFEKLVMIGVQLILTTIAVFIAYKIINKLFK
ncbi:MULTISPECIES: hypothetical protein [Alkalihalophilus]|uniref:Uncharacterized protein n=2 Tax=Alkalihalophilus TaxID=2893060 RepID=D3FSI5_ALKPO|nr:MULTISPECIES: hypothetical protein [Alkalihalophilus]ADC49953.1 hypothetical protein BpOF4_09490 [Alkalihalophilus pseudofirmus OF4]ERN51745.1 hypothetical protein A33I_01125 [Alkalihalophilus marmarensis DSM 21297]MCM3491290.1 hypothetical protein [Alkalihalophilus marmarensis]MEC2071035.1 hypothetical protein [Alkalihalophilus marmarensis]WEG17263.1 hypothetical protein PQ478_01755 [Alkalihalophilus pseudofirmus]